MTPQGRGASSGKGQGPPIVASGRELAHGGEFGRGWNRRREPLGRAKRRHRRTRRGSASAERGQSWRAPGAAGAHDQAWAFKTRGLSVTTDMQGQKPPPPAPRTVLRFVQLRRSNEPEARQSSRHRVRRPVWRRSIEPLGGSLHCCQVGSSAHRIAARSEVNGQLPSTAGRRTGWRILPCMLCVAGRVAISDAHPIPRTAIRVREALPDTVSGRYPILPPATRRYSYGNNSPATRAREGIGDELRLQSEPRAARARAHRL